MDRGCTHPYTSIDNRGVCKSMEYWKEKKIEIRIIILDVY